MRTITNFGSFRTRETPPSTALRDLAQSPSLSFSFGFSLFAVELAIRPRFSAMRKHERPQSSFEKERVGQK